MIHKILVIFVFLGIFTLSYDNFCSLQRNPFRFAVFRFASWFRFNPIVDFGLKCYENNFRKDFRRNGFVNKLFGTLVQVSLEIPKCTEPLNVLTEGCTH